MNVIRKTIKTKIIYNVVIVLNEIFKKREQNLTLYVFVHLTEIW